MKIHYFQVLWNKSNFLLNWSIQLQNTIKIIISIPFCISLYIAFVIQALFIGDFHSKLHSV